MKTLSKCILSAVGFTFFTSIAMASVFGGVSTEKSGNDWVHYSNLDSGNRLVDLYVNGSEFRITGCGDDAYGRIKPKVGKLLAYNMLSNLNRPIEMCGVEMESVLFSASKVVVSGKLPHGATTRAETLQELNS